MTENFESFGFVAFYFVLGCAEHALKHAERGLWPITETGVGETSLRTTVEVLHKLIDQASWIDGRD